MFINHTIYVFLTFSFLESAVPVMLKEKAVFLIIF